MFGKESVDLCATCHADEFDILSEPRILNDHYVSSICVQRSCKRCDILWNYKPKCVISYVIKSVYLPDEIVNSSESIAWSVNAWTYGKQAQAPNHELQLSNVLRHATQEQAYGRALQIIGNWALRRERSRGFHWTMFEATNPNICACKLKISYNPKATPWKLVRDRPCKRWLTQRVQPAGAGGGDAEGAVADPPTTPDPPARITQLLSTAVDTSDLDELQGGALLRGTVTETRLPEGAETSRTTELPPAAAVQIGSDPTQAQRTAQPRFPQMSDARPYLHENHAANVAAAIVMRREDV
jgi:hypothetical protein